MRRKQLIEALGFSTQPGPNGTLLLSIGGHPPRAVAVLLDDSEQFDAKTQRFQLSPVAFGLAVASRQEVPWLVVLRKDQIRLYPGRDGVGVGSKGQAETFFEVDLSTIDSEYAALLPLIFSASALAADGTADELLRDSSRYATELGARLRERIYDEIVPPVAVEVAQRLAKNAGREARRRRPLDSPTASRFASSSACSSRPMPRIAGFCRRAATRASTPTASRRMPGDCSTPTSEEFGDASTIWLDLVQVWNAIDQGNPQWQIPSYNGGLFSTDPDRSPEGALIKKIELPDSVLGPALKSLLIDVSDDGVLGPVDFRSLSVREFGTIYEGLLGELALARRGRPHRRQQRRVGPGRATGDEVCAPSGAVYFHTASGERKATGSYFTPKVVVDHLIERSIVPALDGAPGEDRRLPREGRRGRGRTRVLRLPCRRPRDGLGPLPRRGGRQDRSADAHVPHRAHVPGVTEELLRLAGVAREALGTDDVAKSEVDEVGLLRRQVARRCIYGLDINPMAVELARLALWIHTFVPGLPMSNLDHGLVNANSLTGIGTIDEALDALQPGREPGEISLFDEILTDQLASAKTLLIDVANASEANKAEVEEGARLLAQARRGSRHGAADLRRRGGGADRLDRAGTDPRRGIACSASLKRPEVAEAADELQPAHMPYLFPEVFLRDRLGLRRASWAIRRGRRSRSRSTSGGGSGFLGCAACRTKQQDAQPSTTFEPVASRSGGGVRSESDAGASAADAVIKRAPSASVRRHSTSTRRSPGATGNLLRAGGRSALVLPRGALSGSALAEWRRADPRARLVRRRLLH